MRRIAKKKNEESRRICCDETDHAKRGRIEELSMQQQRNLTIVCQMMAQIRDLQNKVNSLSGARALYDPELGSSSGATHVPLPFPSPRTLPRCDSGLPSDTQNGKGISGNVFVNDDSFKKDNPLQSSTSQRIWHLLLRNWELLNARIQSHNFQSWSGMSNHTCGTYSYGGMMDCGRILITEWNLGK